MSIASAIAVSGMNVATLQLQVSARDVANALSSASVPQQVVQVDTQDSVAAIEAASPALRPAYVHKGPDEDGRAFPTNPYSVLTNEMVQQLLARFNLVADAHLFSADARMQANLLYLFTQSDSHISHAVRARN
jgi:hypothetical protein